MMLIGIALSLEQKLTGLLNRWKKSPEHDSIEGSSVLTLINFILLNFLSNFYRECSPISLTKSLDSSVDTAPIVDSPASRVSSFPWSFASVKLNLQELIQVQLEVAKWEWSEHSGPIWSRYDIASSFISFSSRLSVLWEAKTSQKGTSSGREYILAS